MNAKSTKANRQVVSHTVQPVVGQDRDSLALRLYKGGMTYRQVGDELGVSQSRARELCMRELRRPAWEKAMAKRSYKCNAFAVVYSECKRIKYLTTRLEDAERWMGNRKSRMAIVSGIFTPNTTADRRASQADKEDGHGK